MPSTKERGKNRSSHSQFSDKPITNLRHRKRPEPLVHSGRHFGRTVYGFCNVRALIVNGLARLADDPDPASLTQKYVAFS
jgi:hypothetical protein